MQPPLMWLKENCLGLEVQFNVWLQNEGPSHTKTFAF